jgi:hypothetical protein
MHEMLGTLPEKFGGIVSLIDSWMPVNYWRVLARGVLT